AVALSHTPHPTTDTQNRRPAPEIAARCLHGSPDTDPLAAKSAPKALRHCARRATVPKRRADLPQRLLADLMAHFPPSPPRAPRAQQSPQNRKLARIGPT